MRTSVPPFTHGRSASASSPLLGGLLTPGRLWGGVFLVWALILTGGFSQWIDSPGVLQYWELQDLLKQRREAASMVESNLQILAEAHAALESDTLTQKREIRKVLGFVGSDEIVFEFSERK